MHWTICNFEIKLLVYEKAPNDKHHRINEKTVNLIGWMHNRTVNTYNTTGLMHDRIG